MKDSPIKILLLESSEVRNSSLFMILSEKGYQIETTGNIEQAIDKILNHTFDLVICDSNVNIYSGFEVFKIIGKYLRNSGIPFFLVLDSFEKEDMLIGLEMGIDNFIASPINKFSLFYNIENQLNKRDELNIFETDHFKDYFNSSAVAMFFANNNKVIAVNEAFCKILNGCSGKIRNMPVDNIFNITEKKQNELSYRRFQNGIAPECKLLHVSCFTNATYCFDINFYRGNSLNTGMFFAEIIPTVFAEILENKNVTHHHDLIGLHANMNGINDNNEHANVKLTEREHQIYELSASGLPIKIIAGKLNLSERTVEKHRANIMAKTNAKNMIEAIVYIQKNRNINQSYELGN